MRDRDFITQNSFATHGAKGDETYSLAILGAKKPKRKFQILVRLFVSIIAGQRMDTNQLVALPKAMLFGRTRSGKDSPRYTHLKKGKMTLRREKGGDGMP